LITLLIGNFIRLWLSYLVNPLGVRQEISRCQNFGPASLSW